MSDQDDAVNVPVTNDEPAPQPRRFSWLRGCLIAIIAIILLALAIWGIVALVRNANNDDGEKAVVTDGPEVSWKDAVSYPAGGSGPADPASVLEGDITAVDHIERLIVSNPDLNVRACFEAIDDETWAEIVEWADQWGSDSPTRIEWQANESRCSWVFPGNITDQIGQDDYENLFEIMADAGYHDTWFVGGEEGSEFGRETYAELIALDATFNRVHVYGPTLPAMPVK